MYVVVQHTITDPDKFWSRAPELMPSIPPDIKLHHTFPTKDGSRAVCVWEGKSVEAVKNFLERHVSDVSTNEYFEVENKESVAMPSAVQIQAR